MSARIKLITLINKQSKEIISPCQIKDSPKMGFTFCCGKTPDIPIDTMLSKGDEQPAYINLIGEYNRNGVGVDDLPEQDVFSIFTAKADLLDWMEWLFFENYVPQSEQNNSEKSVRAARIKNRYILSTTGGFVDFLHTVPEFRHLNSIIWQGMYGRYVTIFNDSLLDYNSLVTPNMKLDKSIRYFQPLIKVN